MAGDDAGDVTKALAAFGAPSIRYHSFGQAPVRPSSVIHPTRKMVVPPARPSAMQTVWPQREPEAALEARPDAQPDAGFDAAGQPPSAPSWTAPPRPLAEWASLPTPPVPGFFAPPEPLVQTPMPIVAAPMRPAAALSSAAVSPPARSAPPLVAAAPAAVRPMPQGEVTDQTTHPKRVPINTARRGETIPAAVPMVGHSLAEVFAWLANAPGGNKPERGEKPVLPDMFRRV